MERNYKDLPLQQDYLDSYLETFFDQQQALKQRDCNRERSKLTVKFGCVGKDDATVIIYFKGDGTSTIQYKTGKITN